MTIQQILSKTPKQLREYCKALSDKDKQDLYKQAIDEVNKGKNFRELDRLDRLAAAIEEVIDKKLLQVFDKDNPFKGGIAMLKFLAKLTERLFFIMHHSSDESLKKLNELDELLHKMYKELHPRLIGYMKNYVEKEFKFDNFLRSHIDIFEFLEEAEHGSVEKRKKATIELIRLFALQPELNYQGDSVILSLILSYIKVFGKEVIGLESDLRSLIALLDKSIERLGDLEYEIDNMTQEGESNIEECRSKMGKIEKELMGKRDKVIEQLYDFRLKHGSYLMEEDI